ncbi:GAF domain-containing protein [Limosilactobacillus mucosae]|uniref:GAF domain-containing protein n=1 Tax=uncultured Limosilactobacillus sp. TaxID=2837629 RepID=UPI00242B36D0|nr:GAF domain-containing protein [Limosilactobacillus mucosae]
MPNFKLINTQLAALLENETNLIANLANASALLNDSVDQLNWAGFYLYDPKENELVLGPFQGHPACMHIAMNKGVCGQSAAQRQALAVDDVTKFPGYISCDAAARSELVIPLIKDQQLLGVLDLDAPVEKRFDAKLQAGIQSFVDELIKHLD